MKISFLVLLLFALACKIDRDKPVDRSKFSFKIGSDSQLFFRNTRQIFYDRQSPDGTWQAYRFSDRYTGNNRLVLTPVIVINWIKDEAYLLIEPSDGLLNEDELRVIIMDSTRQAADTVILQERGRERMLEFGSQLYEALQSKKEMLVLTNQQYVPILTEDIDREAFRVTMADYYRLTRIF
jgi:hypothetical protein